jgi:hypothetical protein
MTTVTTRFDTITGKSEEGLRMPSNLLDCDPAGAKVGTAVQVTFEQFPDGGVIPVFRPV